MILRKENYLTLLVEFPKIKINRNSILLLFIIDIISKVYPN